MTKTIKIIFCLILVITYTKTSFGQIEPVYPTLSFSFKGHPNGYNEFNHFATHGIISGAKPTSDRFDQNDNAYDFDGKSTILINFPPPQEEYSYSIWINPRVNKNNTIISSLIDSDDHKYEPFSISIQNKKIVISEVYVNDGSIKQLISNKEIEINKWQHIVAIKFKDTLSLYINGQFDSEVILTKSTYPRIINSFTIGAEGNSNGLKSYFDGKIDNIKIYDEKKELEYIQYLLTEKPDPLDDADILEVPDITMLNPNIENDSVFITLEEKINISSKIEYKDQYNIRIVELNGKKVNFNPDTEIFNKEIKLEYGINPIKIKAIGGDEKTSDFSFYIKRVRTKDVPTKEKRMALLIGNANYRKNLEKSYGVLKNPINDIDSMENQLKLLGFEVIKKTDANKDTMLNAFVDFSEIISKDTTMTALFYYSGHGMQVNGFNYLVPVDAIPSPNDKKVDISCVKIDQLMDRLKEAKNKTCIVILDACRTDPTSNAKGETVGQDLAPLKGPSGSFVAFATASGNVASDGNAKSINNSIYTHELLQVLKIPLLTIEDVFNKVGIAVKSQKDDFFQEPGYYSSLNGKFYFNTKE